MNMDMNGSAGDDDLAARTANLAVSDAPGGSGANQPAGANADPSVYPPMRSVWPASTHAQSPVSPAGSFGTFDVADRSFDKDPNVLKAEHARITQAVYYRESPLREVPPATLARGVPNGALAGAGGAAGGAGLVAAGQGLLNPAPSPSQRSLDGQIGDTRVPDGGITPPNEPGPAPPLANFAAAPMPQASIPQARDLAGPSQAPNMPMTNSSAPKPRPPPKSVRRSESIPRTNGFADQNGLPNGQDPTVQNQAAVAPPQNNHTMAKAAGVGAGAGLAAAGAAHMLNSQQQPQQAEYVPTPGAADAPQRALSPMQQPNAAPLQVQTNDIAAPAPVQPANTFRRLSGQHVEGYHLTRRERSVSETTRANTAANAQTLERPQMYDSPSRSYTSQTVTPETRYERPLDGVSRRLSQQSAQRVSRSGSTKFIEQVPSSPRRHSASPVHAGGVAAAGAAGGLVGAALGEHVHTPRADPYARPASAHEFNQRPSVDQEADGPFARQRPSSAMAGSVRDGPTRRDSNRGSVHGPLSPTTSMRGHGHGRLPPIADEAGYAGVGAGTGLAVGQVATLGQQHELQGRALRDDGPVPYQRPYSQFGHRPEPGIGDWQARREDGRLARSGTALSRTTIGRSGTQRSRRSGAFGRGAGLTVGTQPDDVLGREDIHARTEVAERVLSPETLRRLQGMEKREGRAFAKMLKAEGKEQARAVGAAIADLKRMAKMQKSAIEAERKSQRSLGKWTAAEHRARMRFLKEKERYEKVEGELRNAENDYEERRDHSAGLTAQMAEMTQELDDMRAQKAADDREREVKLLAIKNPGHV